MIQRMIFSLLLACTLGLQPAMAQKVTTNWGAPIKGNKSKDVLFMAGRDESGYYVVALKESYMSSGKYYLEKYDYDNKVIFSKELSMDGPDGHKLKLENVLLFDDRIILFTSGYSRKEDLNYAYATRLTTMGIPEGKTLVVDKIKAEKKKNSGSFRFELSSDSSKILVFHSEPQKDEFRERFHLKVLDADLNTLWQQACTAPYRDEDFSIVNFTLSAHNKVYILGRIQEGRRESRRGKPTYKYTILAFDGTEENKPDGAEPIEYVVSLADKFISDITFSLDKEDNLICAGFYSRTNSDDVSGSFFLKIDKGGKEVLQKSIADFSPEMLGQFLSQKEARRQQELPDFRLRQIMPRTDGGFFLLGEQYLFYVSTYTDYRGRPYTVYNFEYNDILVVNVSREGKIEWITRIPKFQYSANDDGYYSSYAACQSGDKLCLIYNDHKDNVNETEASQMKTLNMKRSVVTLAVVNPDGTFDKAELLNSRDRGIYIRPKSSMKLAANELLLYGRSGSKYLFGQVRIDQE